MRQIRHNDLVEIIGTGQAGIAKKCNMDNHFRVFYKGHSVGVVPVEDLIIKRKYCQSCAYYWYDGRKIGCSKEHVATSISNTDLETNQQCKDFSYDYNK